MKKIPEPANSKGYNTLSTKNKLEDYFKSEPYQKMDLIAKLEKYKTLLSALNTLYGAKKLTQNTDVLDLSSLIHQKSCDHIFTEPMLRNFFNSRSYSG